MQISKKEATVLNSISRNSILPILMNTLYTRANGGTLTKTDREVMLQIPNVGNDISENVFLPNKLEGGKEYTGNAEKITIGNSVLKPDTSDLDEYPIPPKENNLILLGEFDIETIRPELEYVAKAAAEEGTRYAINGILLQADKKGHTLVGTDGKRLHIAGKTRKGKHNFILSPQLVSLFLRLTTAKSKGRLTIENLEKVYIRFTFDVTNGKNETRHYIATGKIIEGNFPHYADVIPSNSDSFEFTPNKDFLTLLKDSAKLSAKAGSYNPTPTVFNFVDNVLHLETKTHDETIGGSVETIGDTFTVPGGFQARYLLDALVVDQTFKVLWKQAENAQRLDSPLLLKSGNFQAVLMPISFGV